MRQQDQSAYCRTIFHALICGVFIAMTFLLSACEQQKKQAYEPTFSEKPLTQTKEYIFGVHPQRNPKKLRAVFGPVVDYLNHHVKGATFLFEASRNFKVFDQKIADRHFDFVLPNPYGTVKALEKGYRVFGRMGNTDDLRGLILVRRDSDIKTIADLKGKKISFPAPTAFGATIMVKEFLFSQGLNVNSDIQPQYVGSMESSLMSINLRAVVAGTAYPPAWRMFQKDQPEIAKELKVMWQTAPLPDNSLMVRDDIPQDLAKEVEKALLTMQQDSDGTKVLANMDMSSFKPATNETYDPVKIFLQQYEARIGPLNPP